MGKISQLEGFPICKEISQLERCKLGKISQFESYWDVFVSCEIPALLWHATFLIKLGDTTIITDPVFEKNMGPLIFGPKRFVDPAIALKEIPEVNLFLLTHKSPYKFATNVLNAADFGAQ